MAEKQKRRNARSKASAEVIRAVLYEAKYSSQTLNQIAIKYGLSCGSLISKWVRRYSSDYDQMSNIPPKDTAAPGSREKELQNALEEAQMKIICLETMIDIAEKEFNLSIRKKSGTKQ